jgi:hypothetical protein
VSIHALSLRLRRVENDDSGSAIVITMLMIAMITALGVTAFTLSTNNLGNARRDRQSASALANSEAGVGQAVAYLKAKGIGPIKCAPNCGAANPWGEEPQSVDGDANPAQAVTLSTNETYDVWIQPITPMVGKTAGLYRIHSIGHAGTGPGTRTVEVDVQVAPFDFPLSVYSDSVQAGGSGGIHTESMFSKGCVFKRSKINFSGTDPVYNIPAAAHSSQYITDTQGAGSSCSAGDDKNIHAGGVCPATASYRFDQDRQGGNLSSTPCYMPGGAAYPTTSKIIDDNDLATQFKFNLAGLSSSQLDLLRTAAQEQGFYITNTTAIPAVLQVASPQFPNPVLFYDLKGAAIGGTVDLKDFNNVTYTRATPLSATSPSCTPNNVIVVVVNGDVRMNSDQVLVGSVFAMGPAPYGNVAKANGNSSLIGTLYSRSLDLTGTADFQLDDCFLQNLPGSLLSVKETNFREVDR